MAILYLLNLHAHTDYSDGRNSIKEMAEHVKSLGYCCFVSSDHDYMMNPEKYLKQIGEAAFVSVEVGIPIVCGLEISMWHEEGVLIGQDACMRWLQARPDSSGSMRRAGAYDFARSVLGDVERYALCLAHPVLRDIEPGTSKLDRMWDKRFYDLFDAYEATHCGQTWDAERQALLRELMPNARPIAGVDAHSVCYFDQVNGTANELESPLVTEQEIVDWMRGKR